MQTRVMMLPALPLPSAQPTGQRASPRSHAMRSTLWVFQRSKPLPALTKLRTLVLRHPLGDAGAHLETRHTPYIREERGTGVGAMGPAEVTSRFLRGQSCFPGAQAPIPPPCPRPSRPLWLRSSRRKELVHTT